MPFNIPGILVPFQLLWNARVIIPRVVVAGLSLHFFHLRIGCSLPQADQKKISMEDNRSLSTAVDVLSAALVVDWMIWSGRNRL